MMKHVDIESLCLKFRLEFRICTHAAMTIYPKLNHSRMPRVQSLPTSGMHLIAGLPDVLQPAPDVIQRHHCTVYGIHPAYSTVFVEKSALSGRVIVRERYTLCITVNNLTHSTRIPPHTAPFVEACPDSVNTGL